MESGNEASRAPLTTLLILLPTDITTRCIVFHPVKAAVSQARSVISVRWGLAGPPCVIVHSPKVQEWKRNRKNKLYFLSYLLYIISSSCYITLYDYLVEVFLIAKIKYWMLKLVFNAGVPWYDWFVYTMKCCIVWFMSKLCEPWAIPTTSAYLHNILVHARHRYACTWVPLFGWGMTSQNTKQQQLQCEYTKQK